MGSQLMLSTSGNFEIEPSEFNAMPILSDGPFVAGAETKSIKPESVERARVGSGLE